MKWKQPLSTGARRVRAWVVSGLHVSTVAVLAAGEAPTAMERPAVAPRREMTTDRPDTTESPYTIEVGHAQLEADLLNHTRDRRGGTRTREWGVTAFNLRLGVRDDLEAGIFVAPWTRRSEEPRGGARTTRSGFGDITLRGKANFWGNNGGGSAGGIILDATLPTAARDLGADAVEGAVSFPVAGELNGGWEFGAMTRVDLRSRANGGHRAVFINTATIGHEVARRLDGYLELTSASGDGTHVATFDTGLAFRVDPNAQLDCGVKLGLSRAADDVVVFAGVSRRF